MVDKPLLPECSALGGYAVSRSDRPPRPRGRPKTRTAEHYAALHAEYLRIAAWFAAAVGRPAKSDAELLTAYFSERWERDGLRRSRASTDDFAGRIKTLRNELSEARSRWRTGAKKSREIGF
jgi:hypothetical protein